VGEAGLYGGSVRGQLAAEADAAGAVSARLDVTAEDVDLAPLLAGFGAGGAAGDASGRLSVSGTGASWGELIGTLTGEASLDIADARFSGVDGSRLGDATAGLVPRFETIAARFTFGDLLARAVEVTGAAGGFTATLRGSASLVRPTIAGSGTLALAGGAVVPFILSGTWAAPVLTPNADSLVPEGAQPGGAVTSAGQ
jgi:hypothetical protein